MKSVKFLGSSRVAVIDRPDLKVARDGEVLVRVRATAICGSEMRPYKSVDGLETNAGHEAAGVVEAVQGCTQVKVGDRVVLFASTFCGVCKHCRSGDNILCTNKPAAAGSGWHAEYALVHERQCIPLPDDISFETGSVLGDAVGVPYRAARRIGLTGFDQAGVIGLGPMGLIAVAICRMAGATVYGVDPITCRRELARELGAREVFEPGAGDLRERIKELTHGEMLSAGMECSGKEAGLKLGLSCLGVHGRLAVIGENPQAVISPSEDLIRREITVHGVWYFGSNDFSHMAGLVRAGLPIDKLVTHRFPLSAADEAYSLFASGESGKVILTRS